MIFCIKYGKIGSYYKKNGKILLKFDIIKLEKEFFAAGERRKTDA